MQSTRSGHRKPRTFARHIALPQDHGSWVFLFSPLLIGLFCADNWSSASLILIVALIAAFLLRQPVSIAVKVISGRRSRQDLNPAIFWMLIYGLIAFSASIGLIWLGFSYLLFLTIPGFAVFTWHLILISKRAERRQMGVELVGSGVLALSAPAAYWVGVGSPDPTGWLLFGLSWLQSAASIVYAYLRLDQRSISRILTVRERFKLGFRAVLYSSFNLLLVIFLSLDHTDSTLAFRPLPGAVGGNSARGDRASLSA